MRISPDRPRSVQETNNQSRELSKLFCGGPYPQSKRTPTNLKTGGVAKMAGSGNSRILARRRSNFCEEFMKQILRILHEVFMKPGFHDESAADPKR